MKRKLLDVSLLLICLFGTIGSSFFISGVSATTYVFDANSGGCVSTDGISCVGPIEYNPMVGFSFNCSYSGTITDVFMYLEPINNPNCTIGMKIEGITGSFGVNEAPNNTVLATSGPFVIVSGTSSSTIGLTTQIHFGFTGLSVNAGTKLCVLIYVISATNFDGTHYFRLGAKAGGYHGSMVGGDSGTWNVCSNGAYSPIFNIIGYGSGPAPASCVFSEGVGGHISYRTSYFGSGYPAGTYDLEVGSTIIVYSTPIPGYFCDYFDFNNGTILHANNVLADQNGNFYLPMTVTAAFNMTAYFTTSPLPSTNTTVAVMFDTQGPGSISWKDNYFGTSYGAGTYNINNNTAILITASPSNGYVFSYFTFSNVTDPTTQQLINNPLTFNVSSHNSYPGTQYYITAVFIPSSSTSTPTPSNGPIIDIPKIKTDGTSLLEMIIGAILVVAALLILMKAQSAWVIGLILFIAGFFLQIVVNANFLSLVMVASEVVLTLVFATKTQGKMTK